jgi:hypothetical protein
MIQDPTFASIVKTCKQYDLAILTEKEASGTVPEVHFTKRTGKEKEESGDQNTEKKRIPFCSNCHTRGHLANKCDNRKKHLQVAKLKRAAKSRDGNKQGQQPGSADYSGCHTCGSPDHWAHQCEYGDQSRNDQKKKKSPGGRNEFKTTKKARFGGNKYVRAEEQDSDEESNMFSEVCDEVSEEVNMTTADWDDQIFLDSCAGQKLCLIKDQSALEEFTHSVGNIQTTKSGPGGLLQTQGKGSFGDWKDVTVCNDALKNLVGGGYLRAMGYGLSLVRIPKVVRLSDGVEVLVADYDSHGMPYIALDDMLHLPNIGHPVAMYCEEVLLSDNVGIHPLELIHMRTAHCAESILIEGYKRMAFTGSGLSRRDITAKAERKKKETSL